MLCRQIVAPYIFLRFHPSPPSKLGNPYRELSPEHRRRTGSLACHRLRKFSLGCQEYRRYQLCMPPETIPLFGRWQPFTLTLLGGCLALAGTVITQLYTARIGEQRFRQETARTRRQEAIGFLEQFTATVAERNYCAEDYLIAMRRKLEKGIINQKEQAYIAARKNMIVRLAILGARGHYFFGDEFKNAVFYRSSVEFDSLDDQLQTFQRTPTDELGDQITLHFRKIELLHGEMLGLAMRVIREKEER